MVNSKKPLPGNIPVEATTRFSSVVWTLILSVAVFACASNAGPAQPRSPQENQGSPGSDARNEGLEPLTVADSIEMTHIVDPSEDWKGAHPKFSPDGNRFLLVTEKGRLDSNLREYRLLIYNAKQLNDKPVQLAIFRSSSNRDGISQAKWLTNESISLIGENPGEAPQVYVVNCRTSQTRKLTSDDFGVAGYDVAPDLRAVIYSAHWGGDEIENKHKDQHGFAVSSEWMSDLNSGTWQRPTDAYQTYARDTSSGKVLTIKGGAFASLEGRLKLWLSPDGKYAVTERPAFPVPESWESYEDRFLKQVAHSIRTSMHSKLQLHWLGQAMLIDTQTGEIKPLVDAPLATNNLFSALWSSDSRSVIVVGTYLPLNESPQDELARRRALPVVSEFSIPSRSFHRIADIPKGQVWSLESASEPDAFMVRAEEPQEGDIFKVLPSLAYRRQGDKWVEQSKGHASGAVHPDIRVAQSLDRWPKLVDVDPTTHQQTLRTDPNPQFQHRRFGKVQTIHWTGKQGERLIGGLIYPVDYRPDVRHPLVIQTHGFDPDIFLLDGPFTTAMAAQQLANKGIAILQIGEGPLYEQTESTPEEGPANLSPLESAIDYLDSLGIIDRSRVGLLGFSRTTYHVKYALTHSHYHFAAAIAAEGIDFGYWTYVADAVNFPMLGGEFERMYSGLPWRGNWKPWIEQSISFNFDKIHTPLRLEADSNPGSIVSEWETFAALRLLNKPVDLIFIPHGAHPVLKPWERMTSQQGAVDWFCFWLKGEEDPDPAKAEQYVHWRELRKLQEQNEANSKQTSPVPPN